MKLNASNNPAIRDFEQWVRRELYGTDDKPRYCQRCGASLTEADDENQACTQCGMEIKNMRGSGLSAAGVKASNLARQADGKPVAVGGSIPPPRCGQCDGPLVDNPATDNTLPFYCSTCDIIYDWEDIRP